MSKFHIHKDPVESSAIVHKTSSFIIKLEIHTLLNQYFSKIFHECWTSFSQAHLVKNIRSKMKFLTSNYIAIILSFVARLTTLYFGTRRRRTFVGL